MLIAFSPEYIPHLNQISIDVWVLGFALTTSMLTGIIFGLFPAIQASNPNLNETLKEHTRGSSGLKRQRLRGLLVIGEIALALVLVISTGLIIRSLLRVQETRPGFDPSGILTLQVFLPSHEYSDGAKQTAFYQRVITRIEAISGVESVGAINLLPMSGSNASLSFTIEGQSASSPDERPSAAYRAINFDYFRTMRIPLVSGRSFTDGDQSKQVAIISDSMARQHPFGGNPIGKYITVGNESETREIIGIVEDVRHSGLDSGPEATFYVPYLQSPSRFMFFAVRTKVPPASMISALQAAIHTEDAALPVYNVKTLEQRLEDTLAPRRFNMFLLSIFSLVALILVVGGIYGIVANSVVQRTHEIGIRMALGAQKYDILFLVLKHALRLTLIGIAAGLMAALLLTRFLSNLLYEVSVNDPLTFIGVTVLLIGVALGACLIPALRATRVDPVIALRFE
jgi:putative ABC transport system permease protein